MFKLVSITYRVLLVTLEKQEVTNDISSVRLLYLFLNEEGYKFHDL